MTSTFDFFEQPALPAPEISADQARRLLRRHYGIEGTVRELGSQQDANFLVESASGRFVLKISHPVVTEADVIAQHRAETHLARREPGLRIPASVTGVDGRPVQREPLVMRLLEFLDGELLSTSRYLAPPIVEAMGDLTGRVSRALAGFDGPVPARTLQWDVRHAGRVVTQLADFVGVPGGSGRARTAAAEATAALKPCRDRLPRQVIHGDITDDNLIATIDGDGRRRPVGLIDFGDLSESWAIAELAVMLSSVLAYTDGDLTSLLPAIVAFDRVRPIADDELAALWPLVVLRAAALMVSGRHQVHVDPGNAYAAGNLDREWRIFDQATSTPVEVMTALIRSAVRPGAQRPMVSGHPLFADPPVPLDLSTTSPDLDGGAFAEFRRPGFVPFLQPRLTGTRLNSFSAPVNAALGVEVRTAETLSVYAPWTGRIDVRDDVTSLRAASGPTLWLAGLTAGVESGAFVRVGERIGELAGSLRVQAGPGPERPPFFVRPGMAEAWAAVYPDPTPLVAPGTSESIMDERLLDRRAAAFATVQEHYYGRPPRIERGWRNHLFDMDGRAYLDMVNNVAILGHGHPRLADAIGRQWRLLNTNSRFHYRAVVEFSERLAALLPDPLDTVFLVNSGSEAVDLALRLAWANTGRRDVIAVREAYHGWTDATDAVSTSVADNPNALAGRPSWVHTVAAPNAFRGQFRGDDAGRYADEAVAYIRDRAPAAFLAEAFYGNAGGMPLPDGYLSQVYRATREAGGLCIADEVQAGYGRLGEHFWGFEQQGVVPDIVTVAKAMGNGHPLGAVITTRAIAEGYRSQGYFFSSAGGSPVSCVAGLTVLDVLRDEGLQENARIVGGHLRRRLLELAAEHPIVGAVHGMGLYLGVELVRGPDLEPAAAEAAAICERLRELGVIMQPTSDRMCVLKIKPPLGIGIEDADFFADALDRVLTEGW